jgi:cytidine deaminase
MKHSRDDEKEDTDDRRGGEKRHHFNGHFSSTICLPCSFSYASYSYDDIKGKPIIEVCHERRLSLATAPTQSLFKVYAILDVLDKSNNSQHLIEGANCESGYIGASICAERSALSSRAFRVLQKPHIRHIYISTDSSECITPGTLCREFMHSFTDNPSETIVEIANCDKSKVVQTTLGALFPYPFRYRQNGRLDVIEKGQNIGKIASSLIPKNACHFAYQAAVAAAKTLDSDIRNSSIVHPIQLGVAVRFSDGNTHSTGCFKALEYGSTLDPVSALLYTMTNETSKGNHPVMLCMADQWGTAHAPFGQARALLNEHNFADLKILIHVDVDVDRVDKGDGDMEVVVVTAKQLMPPLHSGHSGDLSFSRDGEGGGAGTDAC